MTDFNPLSRKPPEGIPWGINFGGGVNSIALVIECHRRGFRPDWILFSDTGSERPETYEAIKRMKAWCKSRSFTALSTTRWIRQDIGFESLHTNCLMTGYMPSKAYGYSGCSMKWKIQPAQKWRKQHGYTRTVYAVGFDAGEKKRVEKRVTERKCGRAGTDREELGEFPWYPLFAWGYSRERCKAICASEGFAWVPKSSCFMCPNMKDDEWLDLKKTHPDLFEIAVNIEETADRHGNAEVGGLRRKKGWLRDLEEKTCSTDSGSDDEPCVCFAG